MSDPTRARKWTKVQTAKVVHNCAPPFSFYFDLISDKFETANGGNLPLHRICTLARKQNASKLVIEDALGFDGVVDEIDDLDEACGGGGRAEAMALGFFAKHTGEDAAPKFLGQAVLINYQPAASDQRPVSYVFEAVMAAPHHPDDGADGAPLLNNFSTEGRTFRRVVDGEAHELRGFYYCQQNRRTHVCAHAVLRMALTAKGADNATARAINEHLGITPPCTGLSIDQVKDIARAYGHHAQVTPCKKLTPEQYLSVLASVVQSGDPALLVFTTGHALEDDIDSDAQSGSEGLREEHVVLAYGHTLHSDEWHPQAIPAYAGPRSAEYYPASGWIDHYLIHDDNFGPYFTLSSRAFEFHQSVRADMIIALQSEPAEVPAHLAEAVASINLPALVESQRDRREGRWSNYLTSTEWRYILRSLLVSRDEYSEHLRRSTGHDGSSMVEPELDALAALPDRFWMVEFTLPGIFTGNHSKIGEVLISPQLADPKESHKQVLGARLPGRFLLGRSDGQGFDTAPSSLQSHCLMLRKGVHGPVW